MAATHVVTGAFGYTGRYIAERLLARGITVRTLTNSPHRANPFGGVVQAFPLNFDSSEQIEEDLRGAEVLYNTYWVRFNHHDFNHDEAVRNTLVLFEAAKRVGVKRVVHTSITNPSEASPLPYFSGKARLERALRESGLSYAILRPTVIFGKEDILIHNIAWTLRRFPVFGVFGRGEYRLQPIHVEDFADLAVDQAFASGNVTIDAIGPETFTYRELATTIGKIIGCPRPVLPVPPSIGYWVGCIIGLAMGDVTITRDEIKGLMAGLLCTDSAPAGSTRVTEWVRKHRDTLGRRYVSELARRKDREKEYEAL